jgi:hypothetical protein
VKRCAALAAALSLCLGCSGSESDGASPAPEGGQNLPRVQPPPVADTCDVPVEAVDVSSPTTVVGANGEGCTEAALDAALAQGGIITFDCGEAQTTLTLSAAKIISQDTILDGGDRVTLSAGGSQRLFVTEGEVNFTVQHITLADARVDGPRGDGPSEQNSGAAIYRGPDSTLTVIGVTFRNNHATAVGNDVGGGAIYSRGGETIIVASTFDGNSAASGGAIGNLRSNLTVINSVFVNNQALDQNGGAIAVDGQNPERGKVMTLCGLVIRNNSARLEGGGVYRYGYPEESTVIDSCTFDSNSAEAAEGSHAGGLYVLTDTPGAMPLSLTNSSIIRNSSANGAAGLFLYNVPVTITNVTVAENVAVHSLAGGIAANSVSGALTNCTIAYNHADASDSFGGGITGAENLELVNTIVAHNTAGNDWNPINCTQTAAAGAHNLQYPAERPSGDADTECAPGIEFADPLLGPLVDHGGPTETLALLPGSPAIGAGENCPATDQRGEPRDSGCDLGAARFDLD